MYRVLVAGQEIQEEDIASEQEAVKMALSEAEVAGPKEEVIVVKVLYVITPKTVYEAKPYASALSLLFQRSEANEAVLVNGV